MDAPTGGAEESSDALIDTREALIEYCLTLPRTYEDYPFDDPADPGAWTVMRHTGNRKSFALIFARGGRLCVNLKCDVDESAYLRATHTAVTPGYHMNKVHWNTITLGGDLPTTELLDLIRHSYDLTNRPATTGPGAPSPHDTISNIPSQQQKTAQEPGNYSASAMT